MTVTEKAYAKINLYLDVLGRRDDGFHDILSVMHSVNLSDAVTVSYESSDTTEITVTSSSPEVPTDKSNIVYRVAEKYLAAYELYGKIHIHIEKKIPIGAGLGGGSSDGAATLRALYRIFGKGNLPELLEISCSVGSDLPFCLLGGMFLCGGRGEKLKKLSFTPNFNFVIAIGKERISTPTAYSRLDKLNNNYVNYQGTPESQMYKKMICDMANNSDVSLPNYNAFEQVTDIDDVLKIKETMTKNGAETVLMSGSGPSVFCYCKDSRESEQIRSALERCGFESFATNSVYPEEFI